MSRTRDGHNDIVIVLLISDFTIQEIYYSIRCDQYNILLVFSPLCWICVVLLLTIPLDHLLSEDVVKLPHLPVGPDIRQPQAH